MEVKSRIFDLRINSENILLQTTVGEYVDLIKDALDANPYQRKKVTLSKTVYSLLREDIKKGCVLPPIVLALALNGGDKEKVPIHDDVAVLREIFERKGSLLILDGLQRTHSFLDILQDVTGDELDKIRGVRIRVEVYLGLNKIGILYRMLTLNTGQTPMSLRQQIEMLYLDYYNIGVDGVRFIREVDSEHATQFNEFNFKEIIEGFNSYIERNEQPLERSDVLENIKSLEKLSHENNEKDIFKEYVDAIFCFIKKIDVLLEGVAVEADDIKGNVWGLNSKKCFKRVQVFSGFGAAVGKMKDHKIIVDLEDIIERCQRIHFNTSGFDFVVEINEALDWIAKNTKKIGNAQRMFFQFYFRELFNSESESYLDLQKSIGEAMHKTKTQLF